MEEAVIGARIRNILEQQLMGAGDLDAAVEDLTEMVGGLIEGGLGTRKGALKGWKTRRSNLKKKSLKKKSGSKTAKTRSKSKVVKRKPVKKVKKSGSKCAIKKVVKRKRNGGVVIGGSMKAKRSASKNPWLVHLAKYRRTNPWLVHLAKYRRTHPNVEPSEMMTKARKSYKPKK